MDDNYILSGDISYALTAVQLDRLLALGDGNCALLYLYALRKNGAFSKGQAAADLCRTEAEIEKAARRLREDGLFSSSSKDRKKPLPPDELPEYTAEDLAAESADKNDFPVIVEEAQRILGKTLTGADMKTLFGIYDYLKLPAEVVILLINHCVEFTKERSGPGRLPSMKTIEKEAYAWFNREIMTLERAEEYLRAKKKLADSTGEVKQILQINGRGFSATERQYVESWLEMGFGPEAIEIAYDRTVVKTGGLQWKYMNSILVSWDKKGLHTAEDIMTGDRRDASPAKGKPGVGGDDSKLMKELMKQWADK